MLSSLNSRFDTIQTDCPWLSLMSLQEGQENLITFENDEIIAVQSLVQYLYSGDYTLCDDYRPRQPDISPFAGGGFGGFGFGRTTPPAPPAANSGFTIPRQPTSPFAPSAPPQFKQPFEGWTSSNSPKLRNKPASIRVPLLCLAHLEVYALADRIGLVQLKMLSEARFSEAASTQWAHPDFYRATAKAYEVAPPGPQGDTLRSSAVTVTALHLREIMANDKDHKFSEMMAENGAFSRDIALRKL